jgi:hypothetical protein
MSVVLPARPLGRALDQLLQFRALFRAQRLGSGQVQQQRLRGAVEDPVDEVLDQRVGV